MQPVYHIYNLNYMFKPPGIIDIKLPSKNKYTNFRDIDTIIVSYLTIIQKQRFLNLIKTNYLQDNDNIFSPKEENIMPYFTGHNEKSFVSFYYKDENMINTKNGELIVDKKVTGSITSRPIYVHIINFSKFTAYYVDYLCIDKFNRKKGIAPQLIQTHNYNQRILNKNIVVSIFKREDELTGIVPLCNYYTFGFPVDKWAKPNDLTAEYTLLEINPQNFRFLYDFITENSSKFDILITTESTNIMELVKTKNIFIYVILCDNKIQCCYFFRKSCVEIEKGLEVLSCIASICKCDEQLFVHGFKISFWKIASDNFFGFSAIENLSDNGIIIDNIKLKTTPTIVSPTAYYFYNFAHHTFLPNKTFIIN